MRGTYKFYQGGELVGEVKNVITNSGKNIIMQYLSGYIGKFADSIAVGLLGTTANALDTTLYAEWERTPVLTVTPDYANTLLVFKGRLPESSAGVIQEVGLFSPSSIDNEYTSRTLVDFDSSKDTWSAGAFATSLTRLGTDSLRLTTNASLTTQANLSGIFFDLSGYSAVDEFRLAYSNNNTNVASVVLRFYTDASNYYQATVSTNPSAGYKVVSVPKGNFSATGSPSWSNITMVGVSTTSTAVGQSQTDFDLLRIEDKDSLSDSNVMISRAAPLSSPITKVAGLPMDIEYTLDVTL